MVEGDTIALYIGKIEMVINQLTNIGNKTFTTRAIIAKIMNNLFTKYENVMSTWDSTPNVAKTLENFTLRLFQQEVGLKNRLEGGVEKVTTYATLLKASETCNKLQRPTFTYEQCQTRCKDIEEEKKNLECHKCGRKGHWV
jgi:DNA-directed RNA polymerase subunit M/transcription elongation factor TFIIS